jgi:hypothetical protein
MNEDFMDARKYQHIKTFVQVLSSWQLALRLGWVIMDTWVCIALKHDSCLIQSGVKPLLDVQNSAAVSSPRLLRRDYAS